MASPYAARPLRRPPSSTVSSTPAARSATHGPTGSAPWLRSSCSTPGRDASPHPERAGPTSTRASKAVASAKPEPLARLAARSSRRMRHSSRRRAAASAKYPSSACRAAPLSSRRARCSIRPRRTQPGRGRCCAATQFRGNRSRCGRLRRGPFCLPPPRGSRRTRFERDGAAADRHDQRVTRWRRRHLLELCGQRAEPRHSIPLRHRDPHSPYIGVASLRTRSARSGDAWRHALGGGCHAIHAPVGAPVDGTATRWSASAASRAAARSSRRMRNSCRPRATASTT